MLAVAVAWAWQGPEAETAGGEVAPTAASRARVERCVDRLLSRADPSTGAVNEDARRYVERTYCAPFERRGWVYRDGALSIRAHRWLDAGRSELCVSSAPEERARTVDCDEVRDGPLRLDCAVLHHVRRTEVRRYLSELRARHRVECDDGTPMAMLGVA